MPRAPLLRSTDVRPAALGGALLLTLLVTACGGGGDAAPTNPTPTRPDTLDVFTPGNVFSPTSAEIGRGGTIRFRISESPDGRGHNVIFNRTGAPTNIPVVKDTTVPRTFTNAGTFPYTCTVHPGMDGEVIVR
jgi:plastocyanin